MALINVYSREAPQTLTTYDRCEKSQACLVLELWGVVLPNQRLAIVGGRIRAVAAQEQPSTLQVLPVSNVQWS